jgi:hypothetical protein
MEKIEPLNNGLDTRYFYIKMNTQGYSHSKSNFRLKSTHTIHCLVHTCHVRFLHHLLLSQYWCFTAYFTKLISKYILLKYVQFYRYDLKFNRRTAKIYLQRCMHASKTYKALILILKKLVHVRLQKMVNWICIKIYWKQIQGRQERDQWQWNI